MKLLLSSLSLTTALLLSAAPRPVESRRILAGIEYEERIYGKAVDGHIPTLIAFHYSGGSARESFENYDKIVGPVRIIVPLGQYKKRDGLSYYPLDYYSLSPAEQATISERIVKNIAVFINKIGDTSTCKPVVSGISQGGDISLLLALHYPNLISASFPLAATIPADVKFNKILGTKLRPRPTLHLMQGSADPIVKASVTATLMVELAMISRASLTLYPGLGHDISSEMKKDYTKLIQEELKCPK